MDNKKKVLQKTVSFVTALSFIAASQNQLISVFADETQTTTTTPAASETGTTTAPPASQTESTTTTTQADKEFTFTIKINGCNDYKDNYQNIINSIFDNTVRSQINKSLNTYTISLPPDDSLSSHVLTENDTDTPVSYISIGDVRLKIESVKDDEISLTEYYNAKDINSQRLRFSCSTMNTDGYVPYGAEFTISVKDGWKFLDKVWSVSENKLVDYKPKTSYTVKGKLSFEDKNIWSHDGVVVHNGSENTDLFFEKTKFIITFNRNDDYFKLNGVNIEDNNKINTIWLDNVRDGYVYKEFNIQAQKERKIGSVILVDKSGSAVEHGDDDYSEDLKHDKKVVFKIPASYTHDETFSLVVETSPEAVDAKITKRDGEKTTDETMRLSLDDQKQIDIPLFLKNDNGAIEYILTSYQYGENSKPETVLYSTIVSNIKSNKYTMKQPYENNDKQLKAEYKKISDIPDSTGFMIDPECVKINENAYIPSLHQMKYNLLTLDSLKETMLVYEVVAVNDDGTLNKFNASAVIDETSLTPSFVFPKPSYNAKVIVITGIISNGQQLIIDPVYFYLDNDSPELDTENDDSVVNSDGWSKSDFKFHLIIDDKQDFSKELYGEEISSALSNAQSDINYLKIGKYEFKKTDAGWTRSSESAASGYVVSVDNDYNVTVSLLSDADKSTINELAGGIDVSVRDACGNVSNTKSVYVKIDHSLPVLDYIQADNVTDGPGGLNNIVIKGSKLIVSTKTSDTISDIKTVELEYAGKVYKDLKHEKVGDQTLSYFEIDETDRKGQIKINLTDIAGNPNTYYYDPAAAGSISAQTGTDVIIDKSSPDIEMSIGSQSTYKDVFGNNWYNGFPELKLKAADKNPEICSGIRSLKVSVNSNNDPNFNTINVDNIKLSSIDNYSISFSQDPVNPELIIASLKYTDDQGIEKNEAFATFEPAEVEGHVHINASVSDYAGNTCDIDPVEFCVDNAKPSSDKLFFFSENGINETSFGTFFNKKVTIKTRITDAAPSSGIDRAILKFNGIEYLWKCTEYYSDNQEAQFSIPESVSEQMFVSGEPLLTIYDRAGNKVDDIELQSSRESKSIVIENKKPVLDDFILSGDNEYTDSENRKWFSSNVNASITIKDKDSGIGHTKISVSDDNHGHKTPTDEYYDTKVESKTYEINTDKAERNDGKFTFTAEVTDNASNNDHKEATVYKDTTSPEITGFEFKNDKAEKIQNIIGIPMIPYGYFSLDDTIVTVKAKDDNASSGLESITCILYNSDSSIYREFTAGGSDIKYENSEYSYQFVVPEGFKGNIEAYATDFVNNVSEKQKPSGFILENSQRHESTSSIGISLPETQYSDINSVPLYSNDVTAQIKVDDIFSGIRKIEWTTSDYPDGSWKTLNVDENGNIYGDEAGEWNVSSTDRNLITGISRNITVTANSNDDMITVRLTDNSGNTKQQETRFSIDKTAPVIGVSFDNNSPDGKYNNIYKASRTATITVNERNFSADRVVFNINNSAGSSVPSAAGWNLVSGTQGTDSAVYQTTVTFFNDGNYSFTADCSDMCDNKAQTFKSQDFIIDKTAPVAEVTFDNNKYKNTNFYGDKRTATIRITDNNFDPERISIHGSFNSKSDSFPVPTQWQSVNGSYTTTVTFKDNGFYTFEVSGSDKAGNALANPYSASFYIDNESPVVTFGGVKNKSANNGDVVATVLFTDANLDTKTAQVTMSGAKRGKDLSLEGKFVQTDDGYLFTAENFPKEKEYDDIYTITASCEDKSGNLSTGTLTFSVNRFGSNYIFDDSTKAIANKYISQEQDIIIREINVDELKSDPVITITKDSESITLTEGSDYQVTHTGKAGEWSEYEYVIFSQNFSDDAAYTVSVYSEDNAGNKNKSIDKTKEAELSFGVDKTAPRCTVLDLDKNGTYKTDSKTVHVSVTDNILINTVDVYLNGSITDSTFDGNECTFEIRSAKSSQSVKIDLTDMAGNITELTLDNILVSTNIVRILMHKTWFRIAGCAVGAGLIGSGTYFIIKKKKERGY
ncbi:MAG: Ig-like domain-containing protein [Oscillospiraceae bacterium]|nr:Ig-like domain-containing protein [Oscillospiraceae bacterium]